MTSGDGTEIFYRAWLPAVPTDRALLLFHRGHEHSGRFQDLVDRLALPDTAIFAWDARGHGRSAGERGYADNFAVLVKDADAFVRHVSGVHGIPVGNMVVLAHSVGAVVIAAWVHDHAPPIRAMVLATPAFRVRLYVPFAVAGLRLMQAIRGRFFVKSYVTAGMLTHDPEQAEAYRRDPLISRNIAVGILLGMHDTATRILDDAGAIRTPTLILAAGSDWVVKTSAQRRFFERLGSPVKEMETYAGLGHAILHEKDRDLPVARAREFIVRAFAAPSVPPPLLDADRQGFTKDEYDRLRSPLPIWSPKRLGFAVVRTVMKTVCNLSTGIREAWRTGFDSGGSLDRVYADRAEGVTPLGWLIDRLYLDSIGWRGIRIRKRHLAGMLLSAIRQLHAAGRPVRILDIASGPGRYLLETIRSAAPIPVTAVLRDRSPGGLEAGRVLARQMNVSGVTYEAGDAFDPQSIAAVSPRPTIAVVSGLYELFPENGPVRRSLGGLAEAVGEGGFLIYTNQPWHPQLEFIARVLVNRDGKPWVMRRRTQAEMDDLVRAAGFRKVGMEIDEYGIFTVSLAVRVGAVTVPAGLG